MILTTVNFPSSSLSHLNIQFALEDRVITSVVDRCTDNVPQTSSMVEMPINGGQYHQAIASLWVSNLIDNLPLIPAMVAHIASAQLTNPHQITSQPAIIISRLSQFHVEVPSSLLKFLTTFELIYHFHSHFLNSDFIIITFVVSTLVDQF